MPYRLMQIVSFLFYVKPDFESGLFLLGKGGGTILFARIVNMKTAIENKMESHDATRRNAMLLVFDMEAISMPQ